MITVSPNSSVGPGAFTHIPKILWADHTANVLTWEIAAIFDPLTPAAFIPRTDDDPSLIWELAPASFFPKFLYFNVWVERIPLNGVCHPEKAEFVGTTGWDGRMNRFYVDRVMLPEGLNEGNQVRFYIQGVTDRGDIPDWSQCVFVDAKIQS
jgi:mannosyl-glycoprotein endo-beta-N-acetylglucosaminidase